MSLQWTLIAGVLYAEIVLVLLMVLPVASPKRWNALFKSRLLQGLQAQAGLYFYLILGVLVLFFLDAIREMRKYSHLETEDKHIHLDAEMQGNMRLFRAQRNFYISGFALFLSLVIRRLVILISTQAGLLAQSEASLKQAQSASSAARSLLNKGTTAPTEDVDMIKKKMKELEATLEAEKKDKLAVKSQAESLTKEYDRLLEEHAKLQKKIAVGDDKKSD